MRCKLNPAIALWLQSDARAGRIVELDRSTEPESEHAFNFHSAAWDGIR